jgi:hypothetical protein
MSALGHKRTFCDAGAMSALPPIADMCGATRDVRFVPEADIGQNRKTASWRSLQSVRCASKRVNLGTLTGPCKNQG